MAEIKISYTPEIELSDIAVRLRDHEYLLRDAATVIKQLRSELERYKKDAERYRWVRTAGAFNSEIGLDMLSEKPELYDAEVDAAIEAEKGAQ